MLSGASDNLNAGLNGFIITEMVINFFLAAALMKLIGFINVLQLIAFSTMMNLVFPPNIQFFNTGLIHVLNVDIFDPEWTTMLDFDFHKDLK